MPPPPPPHEMGVKMFELAQTNILSPERKKGGATNRRFVANCWKGLGLGGGLSMPGRSGPGRRPGCADGLRGSNRGSYARVVHGIASRPKSKPKPAATPLGGPRSRTPPTHGTPSPRPWGPSSPPRTAKAGYVDCVLAFI